MSKVLTLFYPLAGTIKEKSYVDCNDSGIQLIQARVDTRLSPLLQNPKPEEMETFVPIHSLEHGNNAILAAKLTHFACGGVAVGVSLLHTVGDAASFFLFMNAWATTSRSGDTSEITPPLFDLALRFPPVPADVQELDLPELEVSYVTKRVVFEQEKLEKLKKNVAGKNLSREVPTSVEAISVLIWQSLIEYYKPRTFVARLAMNLRPRLVPRVPDHTFGNCGVAVSATFSMEEDECESGVLASKLRAAIRSFDTHEQAPHMGLGICTISSWWRFPMYDVDFGWGKPDWVFIPTFPLPDTIFLLSTPSGDGIEASINAHEDFFELLLLNYNKLLLD